MRTKIIDGHTFYYYSFGKTKVDAKRKTVNVIKDWYARILPTRSGYEIWIRKRR